MGCRFGSQSKNVASTSAASAQTQSSTASASNPATDSQGGIDVTVSLEGKGDSAAQLKFLIQMSNHMVSLDNYDYREGGASYEMSDLRY